MPQSIQASNDPNYRQSRAALRQLYGSRRIDASAPYSAADSTPSALQARQNGVRDNTPSGRERFYREQGMSQKEVKREQNAQWRTIFPSRWTPEANPLRAGAMQSPVIPPRPGMDIADQMRVAQAPGRLPSLAPQTAPNMDALAEAASNIPSLFASSSLPATGLASFYNRQRPSVLNAASKWISPV